jgi:hypothetical protein
MAKLLSGTRVYGNLTVDANLTITGSILPSANITYDLGSPTQRWRSAYFSGNTIYLGGAVLSSSGQDILISTTGGFGVPVGTTAQRTATLGALRFNTDTSLLESKYTKIITDRKAITDPNYNNRKNKSRLKKEKVKIIGKYII